MAIINKLKNNVVTCGVIIDIVVQICKLAEKKITKYNSLSQTKLI